MEFGAWVEAAGGGDPRRGRDRRPDAAAGATTDGDGGG